MTENRVTSAYTAIVRGKSTGLAGCGHPGCPRPCLRRDPQLDKHNGHGYRLVDGRPEPIPWQECRTFIPAGATDDQ